MAVVSNMSELCCADLVLYFVSGEIYFVTTFFLVLNLVVLGLTNLIILTNFIFQLSFLILLSLINLSFQAF